jgi:hypothetical protein
MPFIKAYFGSLMARYVMTRHFPDDFLLTTAVRSLFDSTTFGSFDNREILCTPIYEQVSVKSEAVRKRISSSRLPSLMGGPPEIPQNLGRFEGILRQDHPLHFSKFPTPAASDTYAKTVFSFGETPDNATRSAILAGNTRHAA